ncbi:hypothetical protein C922_02260 [Plasmodium inui San Antonio 1]|uniref:Pv-fam-h protein n=1 Tax=Plasmodium inui San Antonio 1 TaxID=1237626 RepID=W7AET0_9APIC|nr:hypothetical protein C922_02260 [Plasmodium inui San Antonio 1]EUD67554.1 hypothetical protein C922_02260 [Plasmodium inui San Antonio 1]
MVEVTFRESFEGTDVESARNGVLSFRKKNDNASSRERIICDKIATFTLPKVLMFLLLIWIIRYSGEPAIHEVMSDRGIPRRLYVHRLLAESEVQLDAMFDLYKRNFLNKMGYSDEDAERIKAAVKSHLDQAEGMNIDEQHRKKLESCEHIIKQGSDNNISKFSNNFRVLSSPYFLSLCSFILFSNGYYRFALAVMAILFLKFVNFFWDLKYVYARMAGSM